MEFGAIVADLNYFALEFCGQQTPKAKMLKMLIV
jgi:hypothetical protein